MISQFKIVVKFGTAHFVDYLVFQYKNYIFIPIKGNIIVY